MRNQKWMGFLFFVLVSGVATAAMAQDEAAAYGDEVRKWLALAAGFGMALASMGGAYSQSKAISAAVTGIARNPGASGKIFTPMIIGLALIESLVLFTFLVANGLSGKI